MPAYLIERTVRVERSKATVLPYLSDFQKWPAWSPWLYMEPGVALEYRGEPGTVGHGYGWKGDVTGQGSMELKCATDDALHMDLIFLRPFKSRAEVHFDITSAGEDATDVTWHMNGKLPFFLFFMTSMMKAMIGSDYARGLKMLKELIEEGGVKSRAAVLGVVDVPARTYVGQRDEVPVSDLVRR